MKKTATQLKTGNRYIKRESSKEETKVATKTSAHRTFE